ncbi:MAG: hypothetical protein KGJ13_08625 [Patescibacteria group bacterium]|nr:hypothetical protein [Patescibacteria group bacterium]
MADRFPFQYQEIAESVPPPFSETVTESRWHQPWSDPVRTPVGRLFAAALIASGPFMTAPQPEKITPDKWLPPLSEPVRTKAPNYFCFPYEANSYQPVETTRVDKWFIQWPDNVRRKPSILRDGDYWCPSTPIFTAASFPQEWSALTRGQRLQIPSGEFAAPAQSISSAPFGFWLQPGRSKQSAQVAGEFSTPPPPPLSDFWFTPWSEPTRNNWRPPTNDFAYGYFVQPTTTPLSWYSALSEPTKQKPNNPQGGSVEAFPVAAAASVYGWQAPLSEPSTVIQVIYQSVQQPVPIVTQVVSIGWFAPLSEPVRQTVRQQPDACAYGSLKPLVSFGWVEPLSEPLHAKPTIQTGYFAYGYLTPAPVTVNLGWFAPLSEPAAKSVRQQPDHFAYGYFTPVPQVVNFGWFSALSEPFPKIAARQQPFAVSYNPFTPTPVSIGWFNPFSEPVRTRVSLYAAPDYAAPIAPIAPVTVPLFGWYAEFSIPAFPVHLRTSEDFAWGYFTPAPTPPPPPPAPVVGSFSVGPQMITGQGSPPGEVYISPPKKGKKGRPKGVRIASDYPKWPGWGKY